METEHFLIHLRQEHKVTLKEKKEFLECVEQALLLSLLDAGMISREQYGDWIE